MFPSRASRSQPRDSPEGFSNAPIQSQWKLFPRACRRRGGLSTRGTPDIRLVGRRPGSRHQRLRRRQPRGPRQPSWRRHGRPRLWGAGALERRLHRVDLQGFERLRALHPDSRHLPRGTFPFTGRARTTRAEWVAFFAIRSRRSVARLPSSKSSCASSATCATRECRLCWSSGMPGQPQPFPIASMCFGKARRWSRQGAR